MKTSRAIRVSGLGPDVWDVFRNLSILECRTMSQLIAQMVLGYVNLNYKKLEDQRKFKNSKLDTETVGKPPTNL